MTVFNTKAGVTDKPWRCISSGSGSGISRGNGVLVETEDVGGDGV